MKTFFTILLSAILAFTLSAQTSLVGKITAAETGEDLIGANVILEKNGVFVIGTSTDFNGNYKITQSIHYYKKKYF